jgi:hypothetical protein
MDYLTLKKASEWASEYLNKKVTVSNISYLIQYGLIPKINDNGNILVKKSELMKYYSTRLMTKEQRWKKKLGEDLNWSLSFSEYKESETTKHVHRLHPYKGKFIPQLVKYFLDDHTNKFKKEVYFSQGDVILDPFCGSGTTLVQANELGMHAIGIDISLFNTLISNAKIDNYDLVDLYETAKEITRKLKQFQQNKNNFKFENKLLEELKSFNGRYFPSPQFKIRVRHGEVNEKEYGIKHAEKFLPKYLQLIDEYTIRLKQDKNDTFIDKWLLQVVRDEIDFLFMQLKEIPNLKTKRILTIVLSRTIRSCRATTHSDLGTLKEPVIKPYYCKKHGKICKPLFSILNWWERYIDDTIKRIGQFKKIRTNTFQKCITGDSRIIDIFSEIKDPEFKGLLSKQKIRGIFSSPPYVGLIDYHEQHAYAYDLFGFEKKPELEIGPLYKGQGHEARESYKSGIVDVLVNCKQFLDDNYDVFLVANDKYGIYPEIAKRAGMIIKTEFKRPVLNRVEKDRNAYSETIFHLKQN